MGAEKERCTKVQVNSGYMCRAEIPRYAESVWCTVCCCRWNGARGPEAGKCFTYCSYLVCTSKALHCQTNGLFKLPSKNADGSHFGSQQMVNIWLASDVVEDA